MCNPLNFRNLNNFIVNFMPFHLIYQFILIMLQYYYFMLIISFQLIFLFQIQFEQPKKKKIVIGFLILLSKLLNNVTYNK